MTVPLTKVSAAITAFLLNTLSDLVTPYSQGLVRKVFKYLKPDKNIYNNNNKIKIYLPLFYLYTNCLDVVWTRHYYYNKKKNKEMLNIHKQ